LSDIWDAVGGSKLAHPINGNGFRLVESQEQVATTEIVSDLNEQSILEEMIDEYSKPSVHPGTEHLNYLLYTSFRYPPLQWGSRFGSRAEPSLLYGGKSEQVTLCESAFYRLFFYHEMEQPFPSQVVHTQHTIFSFDYATDLGIQLQHSPFVSYEYELRNPKQYEVTQELGSAMRNAGIKAFEYSSARDPDKGVSVALFDATPLVDDKPYNKRLCLCQTGADEVIFNLERNIFRFGLDQFLIDGELPRPSV
jgi:hypothetical protein